MDFLPQKLNIFYSKPSFVGLLKNQKIIGKTNSVRMVAETKPPIITMAKGFCSDYWKSCSKLIPEEKHCE